MSRNMERYVQGHKFQGVFVRKAEQKTIPSAFPTLELLSQVGGAEAPSSNGAHLPRVRGEALSKEGRTV